MDAMKKDVDYLKYIYAFHKSMLQNKVMLVYQGEVTHEITKAFSSLAEEAMNKHDVDTFGVKRKVYHIMIECLQNIFKYADDPETGEPVDKGMGVFVVERTENEYSVTTGNAVAVGKVQDLKTAIDNVNSLDKKSLDALYKKTMLEGSISESGGAGLGFIDIARKTGQKLIYHFEPINDKTSFFLLLLIRLLT